MIRRMVVAIALAAALVLASAGPVAAHASLISSTPGDGARLDTAPSKVTLEFSERVSVSLGGVRVFDHNAHRVDRGAVRSRGANVEVDLASGLGEGTYVVTYRIISADGHPVKGGLVFSVGKAATDTNALARFFSVSADRPYEIAGAMARWFAYTGVLLAAGGAMFLALIHDGGGNVRQLRRVTRGAAVAGGVGLLATLPVQAALATGQGFGSLFQSGVLGDVLADGVGPAIATAAVGLLILARGRGWLAVGGAAIAAGSFALTGHTRVTDPIWVGSLADVVHLLAAATWLGGIFLLALTLRARVGDPDAAPAMVRIVSRFSVLATVSIAAVTAAGLALAWTEVRALRALTSTTYGWVLIAKVGVVTIIGLTGAYNHFRLVPALRAGRTSAGIWARLQRTVRIEAAALLVVVALTSVLVNVTPARTAAGIGQLFAATVQLDDAGSVQLVVDPNRAGYNQIHLYLYGADGRPAEIAEGVTVSLSLPASDIGPIRRDAFRAGPAHFQVNGNELATPGRWTLTITARISKFKEATGSTEVLVNG